MLYTNVIQLFLAEHDLKSNFLYSCCAVSMDIPDPFLPPPPYRSSLPVGPQNYTPYPHRAAVCRFKLAALLLHGHVKAP